MHFYTHRSMEGGGDRKRKPGPVHLDWDKLLSQSDSDDESHDIHVVKEAAENSKPCVEADMGGGMDESHIDSSISKFSMKELCDKISRARHMIEQGSLSDGGEKLKLRLKNLEAECERRTRKDDDKCKVNPVTDKPTFISVNSSLSTGAPISDRASQSRFAHHFCRKLENESDHRDSKAFGKELSTLHRCDNKNIRATELVPSQRTQKIGLSSRDTPFKSPSHLSVKIDDPPRSKFKPWESHTYTPSPRHSDADHCFRKNGNAPRVQPSRKCARKDLNTVVLVDEEDPEVDATDPTDQVDQSSKENPIYYPSRGDPEAIEIHYTDMGCLARESYLSSTIMNFYIRYLQKPASPASRRGYNYHFFNTYFYQKLKQFLSKNDKETAFAKFRRWWKGVNIFEKAYTFLPIHDSQHWSLVIICIPDTEDESWPVILHLDSLGLHSSRSVFSDVKRFLAEELTFLKQGEGQPELSLPEETWKRLPRKIDVKVVEVPQQKNEYDCGLFVLFFMERFIEEAPERLKKKDLEMFGREWFKPEEASSLRQKIKDLLTEEFQNASGGTSELDK